MQRGLYFRILSVFFFITAITACTNTQTASEISGADVIQASAQTGTTDIPDNPAVTIMSAPTPTEARPTGSEPVETIFPEITDIDYTAVRPYEVGQIMIIMYHGLVKTEAEEKIYQRSIDNFKNDLQTFYDRGFRLISMKDWLDNNISTPAGYTPLILTFDDGKSTSFSLEYADGKLRPSKDCAVDIMIKFYEEHPDFGNTAMFFINQSPFKGEGTLEEKFKFLLDHGYEIGNHTMNHRQLSKMNAVEIQNEIGGIDRLIKENAPGYKPCAISYPYGERPLKALHELILNGVWEGGAYQYRAAVSVGQSGSPSAVNRIGFDPINVPRVRGSNNQETDMGWMLKQYESKPELRYISDGNPGRIAVPRQFAGNVDTDSLNGKELFLYDT